MAITDRLITGQINLELQTHNLEASMAGLAAVITAKGREYERAIARSITDPLTKAEQKATWLTKRLGDATKASRLAMSRQESGYVAGSYRYLRDQYGSGIRGGIERAGHGAGFAGAAGVGLTFSAAAAAGSTTFNTLTGSLKMFSLAVGEKTQASVLSLSRRIQSFARVMDKTSSETFGTYGGAIAGAGIGGRIGGLPGALIGGGLGALGGTILGTKFKPDFEDDLAIRMLRDPKRMKIAEDQANMLERDNPELGFWERHFGDRRKAQGNQQNRDAAQMIRGALKKARDPNFQEDMGLMTAGLGGGEFHALADLRMQAQRAVFDADGQLGRENQIREMNLNLKAIAENTRPAPQKNQAAVAPQQ
jgi:hypothetical protein